jgi:hypothetical protein
VLFYVGEIFGKGKLIGYWPGAEDSPYRKQQRGEIEHH